MRWKPFVSFGQLIKALSMTLAVQILLLLFMFRQESTAYYPCKNELDNQLHPLLQLQFFFSQFKQSTTRDSSSYSDFAFSWCVLFDH